MILPSTYLSALALLLLSLICFSTWPNFFKQAEPRWRFELFSLDFAGGALLTALLAANTLGTLGSEVSFGDRMLVAGRQSEVWIVAAGFLYALGNALLLAGVSLLGLCGALPITFGLAAILIVLDHVGAFRPGLVMAGVFAMLLSAFAAIGANSQRASGGATRARRAAAKGHAVTLLAGLAFGTCEFMLKTSADPEFGPGPYAAILLFAVGLVLGAPAVNFYIMNIKVTGSTTSFRCYLQGGFRPHLTGAASGAVWAIGALSLALALNPMGAESPGLAKSFAIPFVSVVILVMLGLGRWKELSTGPSQVRTLIIWSSASYIFGLVLFGLGAPGRIP